MAQSGYAKRLQERQRERERIVELWISQLCLDVMADVLNDPNVMGKDVMGARRQKRIAEAFNDRYPQYEIGLTKKPDSDYIRAKVDERQRQIFGPDALVWRERYPYWED